MDTLKVQNQIRQNAEEMSSYLSDISKWENKMKNKTSNSTNQNNIKNSNNNQKIRESGTIKLKTSQIIKAPDSHTYDKGYKKWETFDVNAALDEIETADQPTSLIDNKNGDTTEPPLSSVSASVPPSSSIVAPVSTTPAPVMLTPASLVQPHVIRNQTSAVQSTGKTPLYSPKLHILEYFQYKVKTFLHTTTVPKARGPDNSNIDPELAERERGNEDYKKGRYHEAIKAYTKCLGMKVSLCHTAVSIDINQYLYTLYVIWPTYTWHIYTILIYI